MIDGRSRLWAFTPDGVSELESLEQRDALPPVRIASMVAAMTTIADLRAVLAPLLDDPYEGDTGTIHCRFCERSLGGGDDLAYSPRDDARFVHAPDCPVLRRAILLGYGDAETQSSET